MHTLSLQIHIKCVKCFLSRTSLHRNVYHEANSLTSNVYAVSLLYTHIFFSRNGYQYSYANACQSHIRLMHGMHVFDAEFVKLICTSWNNPMIRKGIICPINKLFLWHKRTKDTFIETYSYNNVFVFNHAIMVTITLVMLTSWMVLGWKATSKSKLHISIVSICSLKVWSYSVAFVQSYGGWNQDHWHIRMLYACVMNIYAHIDMHTNMIKLSLHQSCTHYAEWDIWDEYINKCRSHI